MLTLCNVISAGSSSKTKSEDKIATIPPMGRTSSVELKRCHQASLHPTCSKAPRTRSSSTASSSKATQRLLPLQDLPTNKTKVRRSSSSTTCPIRTLANHPRLNSSSSSSSSTMARHCRDTTRKPSRTSSCNHTRTNSSPSHSIHSSLPSST